MSYIKKKYILKYTNDGVNWIYTNPPQYKYIWSDDTYIWDGEETICGSVLGGSYDSTSEYEVWRNVCNDNVEYRNPKKSYKCGYVTYQWREDENNVCGNALPEKTTEVNKAPELNTDFE